MPIFLESMIVASYVEVAVDGRPSAMGILDSLSVDRDSSLLIGLFGLARVGGLEPGAQEITVRWEVTNATDPGSVVPFGEGSGLVRPVDAAGQCYVASGGVLLPPIREWRADLTRITVRLTVNGTPLVKDIPVLFASVGDA